MLALLFVSLLCLREIAAQELYVVPQQPLSLTRSPIQTAKLNPKGDLLAVAGAEKTIKILDGATLKERVTLSARSGRIMALAFSRDGKYLVSAGGDGLITLWSVPDGALLKEFSAHGDGLGVRSLDIDAAGKIVSGGGMAKRNYGGSDPMTSWEFFRKKRMKAKFSALHLMRRQGMWRPAAQTAP